MQFIKHIQMCWIRFVRQQIRVCGRTQLFLSPSGRLPGATLIGVETYCSGMEHRLRKAGRIVRSARSVWWRLIPGKWAQKCFHILCVSVPQMRKANGLQDLLRTTAILSQYGHTIIQGIQWDSFAVLDFRRSLVRLVWTIDCMQQNYNIIMGYIILHLHFAGCINSNNNTPVPYTIRMHFISISV